MYKDLVEELIGDLKATKHPDEIVCRDAGMEGYNKSVDAVIRVLEGAIPHEFVLISDIAVKSKEEMYHYLRKRYNAESEDFTRPCNEYEYIAREAINLFENNLRKAIHARGVKYVRGID